jgi:hypothetical protein
MIKSLLALLAKLAEWGFWERKRKADRDDDPENKYAKAKEENAKAVVSGDADHVNARLDARLDSLQNAPRSGDSK